MTFFLRKTQSTDCALLADWARAEGWPGRTKLDPMSEDALLEIINMPDNLSFSLCRDDGRLAGFGQVWIDSSSRTNLVRVLVESSLRGQGFGKLLSRLLLMEATRHASVVRLRVRRDNFAAIAVYKSIGFRIVDEESNSASFLMTADGPYAIC